MAKFAKNLKFCIFSIFAQNFRFAFKLPSKCAKTGKITKFAKNLKFCSFSIFPQISDLLQIAFKMCQNGQNHQICQKSQILHFFRFLPKVSDLRSNCLQNVPTRSKSPNLPKISNFANFGNFCVFSKSARFAFKLPSKCANTVKITKFAKNLKFCIFFDFCPKFQICLQTAFKYANTVKITKFAKNLKFFAQTFRFAFKLPSKSAKRSKSPNLPKISNLVN